ncbi:MAG: hypothetical protein IKO28_07315 [Prevotella sp.]|nr:hypothetical protein [Prevotella sp.]
MNKRITIWTLAVMLSCSFTAILSSCSDDDLSNSGGYTPFNPNYDRMDVKVTSDIPTAVISNFDDKSMGAALQRRLSKTSSSIQHDTKMVLIKGEDIKSRPITEWLEATKIYLRGGFIAIEKPHNAHLVEMMEQVSAKLNQAAYDILTDDDDSDIKIEIEEPDEPSSNSINADAAQMSTRLANIEAMTSTSSDDNAPVAEMVIFSRKGYYQCAPYGTKTFSTSTSKKDGTKTTQTHTITQEYNLRNSGYLADGAAEWINDHTSGKASSKGRLISKADGQGAINELMSASEEHTYQTALLGQVPTEDYDCYMIRPATKDNGFKEIVRIWGVHNMNNNKDYYCIEQKVTASVGGQKDNYTYIPVTIGGTYHAETLYLGPYKENEWLRDDFYGAWFNSSDFSIDIKGNGDIKLEDAIPDTDNNDVSRSVAVGETHSETNSIGATITGIFTGSPGASISGNYSHGWTDGTSFTMTTTSNAKELKCVKNTDGTTAKWQYSCGTDMMNGDDDEHPLAPDALTNDVDIDNQVCYSVNNPSGAYTIDVFHKSEMASLYVDDDDKEKLTASTVENDNDAKIRYTLATPNRAKQMWTMDVTFPEIAEEGYEKVKTELTQALQNQFPDLYQPHLELADQTEESENTIQFLVNYSKELAADPNSLQTLKEYALTYKISQFTIKWYNTDHNVKHNTYNMTIKAK